MTALARYLAALVAMAIAGCATAPAPHSCRHGEEPAIVESLYFGTAMPGGRVSVQEWQRFLADTITPRFPDGLTAWAAAGQWRNSAGELQKEDSFVLHVVHKDEAKFDTAVREVIAVYRSRFRQDSVLRVRAAACMSFRASNGRLRRRTMERDKTRLRMLAEFESLLKDEKAHIAKYTRTAVLAKWGGIALLILGLAMTGPWDWATAAAALFTVTGAFLAGVSLAFDNSLKSWPIIRTLLKENALEILKADSPAANAQ